MDPIDVEKLGSAYEATIDVDERRRRGSHYTPFALAERIVDRTLRPVLDALGALPKPEQILELKICDPAMGPGVFLIAASGLLALELERAWVHHGAPAMPSDVDRSSYARRLVAECCLYGVDKDQQAVELAKRALAVRHRLRCGDALVGGPSDQKIESFFGAGAARVQAFHWELEFPEVFARENPGFDAVIGNPPFMGGSKISSSLGPAYLAWILALHEGAHGNGDLVAHFFRRAFELLRRGGTFGLVATKTIAQGDARRMGLRMIKRKGGVIYEADRNLEWPGEAAVAISIVHVAKERFDLRFRLDGRPVENITAFLFERGSDEDPQPLAESAGRASEGVKWRGTGFILSREEMNALVDSKSDLEIVRPLLIGDVLMDAPDCAPDRWIIDFGRRELEECKQWPRLLAHLERTVRKEREQLPDSAGNRRLKQRWWRFERSRDEFMNRLRRRSRCLALGVTGKHHGVTFVPTEQTFSNTVVLFDFDDFAHFAVLQSRVHEAWALFLGSTLEDRPRYTLSTCFDTFPEPAEVGTSARLTDAGAEYDRFRKALMNERREGLTAIYNRLRDPDERDAAIVELRELHAVMDRAVLDSYGWTDLHAPRELLRWPDELRDEVLARLLALNESRPGKTAPRPRPR